MNIPDKPNEKNCSDMNVPNSPNETGMIVSGKKWGYDMIVS
jgi:hypothetical protein